MKIGIIMLLLLACFLCIGTKALAFDPATPEEKCPAGAGQKQDSTDVFSEPEPVVPEGSLLLLLSLRSYREAKDRTTSVNSGRSRDSDKKIMVYFFWGKGVSTLQRGEIFSRWPEA